MKSKSLTSALPTGSLLPFVFGTWLSIVVMIGSDVESWPIPAEQKLYFLLTLLWESALSLFFFTILVSMWVVIRSNGREFYKSVSVRVFLIGVLTPAILIASASCFELLHYPQLTQASPELEIQLVAAFISAEVLVRVISRVKPEMLETEE